MRAGILSLIVAVFALAAVTALADDLNVTIPDGILRGKLVNPSVRFFGAIPFASAPVGHNRWRPPQPNAPWTGVRDASSFGPMCIQLSYAATQTEDCLCELQASLSQRS